MLVEHKTNYSGPCRSHQAHRLLTSPLVYEAKRLYLLPTAGISWPLPPFCGGTWVGHLGGHGIIRQGATAVALGI